jgi:hypothetical protein
MDKLQEAGYCRCIWIFSIRRFLAYTGVPNGYWPDPYGSEGRPK